MFDPIFRITNEEFVNIINEKRYFVNYPDHDTRPYVLGGPRLPVSYYDGGCCDCHPSRKYVKGSGLAAFLDLLKINRIVAIPEYSCKQKICSYHYLKTQFDDWVFLERVSSRS